MKLPIPLLLYTTATGLVGFAGWQVYEMLPLLKKERRDAATSQGIQDGTDRLGLGKGSGPVTVDWQYTDRTAAWWAEFKSPNFLGKLPPKPVEKPPDEVEVAKPVDLRPLDQIIELVSLVYDSKDQGKGEISHVIVRYKSEANVQPPEWYLRETASASAPAAAPRDVAPPRPGGNPNGPTGRPAPRPASAMPASMVGRDVLQKVWVRGDGPRREPKLWPPFDDIELVRVADNAQSAYFLRKLPPPKAGEPARDPIEERLFKTSANLSQDVKRELDRIQGRTDTAASPGTGAAPTAVGSEWLESEETTQVGKVRNIGRKDEKLFRENADELLEQINVDTYVSKYSSTRGLKVLNVEPQIAARFGIAAQDVLLSINNRPVSTKGQAMQFGRSEYQKGVRTFVTRWLSGGQEVERIYQAPDR